MSVWWWVIIVGVVAGIPAALTWLTVNSLSDQIKALTKRLEDLMTEEDET